MARRGYQPTSRLRRSRFQEKQLKATGCELIYKDEDESGGKRNRPQLNKALDHIRKGDVLIVCKLDRLTRSLVDLLDILKKIEAADAAFRRIIAVSHNAIRESFNHASKE